MRPVILILSAALAFSGCDDGAAPAVRQQAIGTSPSSPASSLASSPSSSPSPSGVFHDPARGLSFQIGDGVAVAAERFAHDDPGVSTAIYTLAGPGEVALTIDLWHNPGRLPLARWFERHLAFMRDGNAAVGWTPLTRHQTLGLLIERQRTPQAFGQRVAVVAAADSVLRITCHRSDDPVALELFERVVASVELREVTR